MDLGNAFLTRGRAPLWAPTNSGANTFPVWLWSRISLLFGIVVVALAAIVGTVLGLSGILRGWVDFTVMRLVEVFYSFPFYLVIAVMACSGKHLQRHVGVGARHWPSYARLVRAAVLSLRNIGTFKPPGPPAAATRASSSDI